MPEPVDYQIVLALRAALMAMSVAAGYYFDVQGLAV
jgi:energy-converting hydrogenase Eha subunit C